MRLWNLNEMAFIMCTSMKDSKIIMYLLRRQDEFGFFLQCSLCIHKTVICCVNAFISLVFKKVYMNLMSKTKSPVFILLFWTHCKVKSSFFPVWCCLVQQRSLSPTSLCLLSSFGMFAKLRWHSSLRAYLPFCLDPGIKIAVMRVKTTYLMSAQCFVMEQLIIRLGMI